MATSHQSFSKGIQVVGRPGRPEAPKQEAEAAEEVMAIFANNRSQKHLSYLLRVT